MPSNTHNDPASSGPARAMPAVGEVWHAQRHPFPGTLRICVTWVSPPGVGQVVQGQDLDDKSHNPLVAVRCLRPAS